MKKIKVLIADDQSLIRDGLKMILEFEENIEVIAVAKNGLEAYEMAKKFEPDIVLMDVRMPKMNGIESTKKIKKKYPDIIIIALTTFNNKDYIIDIFNYGASGYILKDIDSDKLIEVIYDAINDNLFLPTEVAKKLIKQEREDELFNLNKLKDREDKMLNLTKLEKKVAMMIAKGKNNKEIASALNIAYGTVRNKVSSIYSKIHINNRTKAALYLQEYFEK